MSTDTDASPRPSLPAQLAQAAVQKSITDALKKAADAHREATFAAMVAAQEDLGTKSFNVKIDGEVVATATITEPSDKYVVQTVNTEAYEEFLDYMQEHYPSEVETIVQVRPNFQKAFLEKQLTVTADGEVFDSKTGEAVPGVKYLPATDPTSWSLRFKNGEESKAHILRSSLPIEALSLLGLAPELETAEAPQ